MERDIENNLYSSLEVKSFILLKVTPPIYVIKKGQHVLRANFH